jgi:dUTP pyrophosphatase
MEERSGESSRIERSAARTGAGPGERAGASASGVGPDGIGAGGLDVDGVHVDGVDVDGLEVDGVEVDGVEVGGVEVAVRRLDPSLPLPAPARHGDAGVDLRAAQDALLAPGGGRAVVGTGLAVAIPYGYCGLVLPRSGLARSHGVTCLNTPGLIDAGYRGELQVLLVNTDPSAPFEVRRGERIAQLVVVAFAPVRFAVRESLPGSERGTSGWGHSGRH